MCGSCTQQSRQQPGKSSPASLWPHRTHCPKQWIHKFGRWWGGVPQIPADYVPEKSVKCTKFGGIQSCYMLPKVISHAIPLHSPRINILCSCSLLMQAVYPLQPQQPPPGQTSLGLWRTWTKPDQPVLWKELEPRYQSRILTYTKAIACLFDTQSTYKINMSHLDLVCGCQGLSE